MTAGNNNPTNERINLTELRETESFRWGPYPWDEDDAGEPQVQIPHSFLLALIDTAEAAYELCRWNWSASEGQHMQRLRETLTPYTTQ